MVKPQVSAFWASDQDRDLPRFLQKSFLEKTQMGVLRGDYTIFLPPPARRVIIIPWRIFSPKILANQDHEAKPETGKTVLTHLLEMIGPTWRHRIAKRLGIYEAMHDDEWLGGYCCD